MSSLEKSTLLPSTKSQTKNDGKWLSIPLCYSFLLIIGIFLFLGTPKSPTSSSSISPPSKIPILSSTLSSDYNPTDPLMLSQLTPSEARTKSKVTIDGIDRGHSGFITQLQRKGKRITSSFGINLARIVRMLGRRLLSSGLMGGLVARIWLGFSI